MRTPRAAVAIPALLLFLGACGGDDDEGTGTTVTSTIASIGEPASPPPTTAPAATTSAAPSDTVEIPLPPPGTDDIPLPPPPDTADIPSIISVVVGTDSGPERIETVALGSTVTIALTNPDAAEEYHLHDYDLGDGQVFEPGQTATFTFIADRIGDFELESHITDDVLMVLRVV